MMRLSARYVCICLYVGMLVCKVPFLLYGERGYSTFMGAHIEHIVSLNFLYCFMLFVFTISVPISFIYSI